MKRKLIKQIAALMLSGAILVSACACNVTSDDASDTSGVSGTSNGQATEDTPIRENLTAIDVANLMGNGINLGNTMEAYGHNSYGVDADTSAYETLWGQPVTTQEMITAMKGAGFDSLRIPVAWTNMMDYENGDYTINPAYLERVEEIVNYALNENMYVLINDHWDGSWWGMFGSATEETRENAMELYTSMWTQICEHFKDYSDYLIFESANEELGDRLNDTDVAADSGTLSQDECYETLLKINQTFVDIVRSSGGNNSKRFLLIAGYNTDFTMTCDDRYIMPTDTIEDHLLVSVHYYTPWDYCGTTSVTHWGSVKEYAQQNELFEMLTKFTEQGYGVIIGEYAVALNGSLVKDNTVDFLKNVLDNCDLYGYCPMLCDCSSLFKRTLLKFIDDDVAELFSSRSLSAQSSMTEQEIKDAARASLDASAAAAEAAQLEANPLTENPDATIAWIMFNSSDYKIAYNVGDGYDPTSITDGLKTVDPEITGPGTYTVSLDFTETASGFANGIGFSAIGLTNGESQYPGCIIDIKSVLINGDEYTLNGKPYTSSDDGKCTRVNLFNGWVTKAPEDSRTADGDLTDASPTIIDGNTVGPIRTLSITFELIVPETAE